jgi:hypothetical protein
VLGRVQVGDDGPNATAAASLQSREVSGALEVAKVVAHSAGNLHPLFLGDDGLYLPRQLIDRAD